MTEACIVGWAHSPFGKLDDPDVESLIGRVARAAIEDAGVAPAEIDAVFVALFNNGFSKQDFPSSLVLQSVPELRFKRATRYKMPALPVRRRCTARAIFWRPVADGSRWWSARRR